MVSSASFGTSTVSDEVSSVAVSSVPQSNSQKDVVVLNAPAKISAALPVGLLLSSRKRMDSESISPNVRSAYATMGFLVSDAGERWKTCASLGLVMSLISYKKPTEFFSDTFHRMSDEKTSIIRQHSHVRSFQYISALNAKLTVTMYCLPHASPATMASAA